MVNLLKFMMKIAAKTSGWSFPWFSLYHLSRVSYLQGHMARELHQNVILKPRYPLFVPYPFINVLHKVCMYIHYELMLNSSSELKSCRNTFSAFWRSYISLRVLFFGVIPSSEGSLLPLGLWCFLYWCSVECKLYDEILPYLFFVSSSLFLKTSW